MRSCSFVGIVTDPPVAAIEDPHLVVKSLFVSLVPLVVLAIAISIMFLLYRRHKAFRLETLRSDDYSPVTDLSPSTQATNYFAADMLEIKASGRFGCVWKARVDNEIVAVKVFPVSDKQSFSTEREFYNLPLMGDHDNILKYIGADNRVYDDRSELWLVTEYHDHGSLYDYLKAHVVTWKELLKIAEGLTTGLAYMHEEIAATARDRQGKPSVAHRDLKSKNILLKKDLTACIGDFGLALKFDPHSAVGDAHGQVAVQTSCIRDYVVVLIT